MFSSSNTGILHEDLPTLGFAPGTPVQVTKSGDLIATMRVQGIDPECLTEEQIESKSERFLAAIRDFGGEYRFSQTLVSSPAPAVELSTEYPAPVVCDLQKRREAHFAGRRLFAKDLYYSFLLRAPLVKSMAASLGVQKLADSLIEAEDARAQTLLMRVATFQRQLQNVLPMELLDRDGVKRFLAQLVRFRTYNRNQSTQADSNLDYWIPNARPSIYHDHVWHDGHYLKALTVREAPRLRGEILDGDKQRTVYGAHAGIFAGLLSVDCGYIATTDWHLLSPVLFRNRLTTLQKNFDSRVVSFFSQWFANKNDTRADMRQDKAALSNRDELGDALVALDARDHFGEYACSVILYDEDLRRVREAIPKVFQGLKGATVLEEDQGVYDAWMAAIPGNYTKNVRALYAPLSAFQDMAFLWTDDTGPSTCRVTPDRQPLCRFITQNHGIYSFAPDENGVVGLQVYGQQGGGKTFFANNFLDHYQRLAVKIHGRWVKPKTFVMDMKDSYQKSTLQHGGVYRMLTLDNPGELRGSPFALPYSKESVERILRLLKLLLSGEDGFRTTPEQNERIVQQINDKYLQKEHGGLRLARLRHMNLGKGMQERLEPWIGSGQYAAFFDNDEDSSEHCDWLTCQYSGFRKHHHVLLPLLYWDFEWFDEMVNDPALTRLPKLLLADELHVLLLASPVIGPWVLEKINTGRSFNLWNVFVMQWAKLLEQQEIGATLNAACPVKIFTASENVRAADYEQLFEMSRKIAEMIKHLRPAGQLLRYSASGAKKLNLDVDAVSKDIYSNDVESNALRYEQAEQEIALTA